VRAAAAASFLLFALVGSAQAQPALIDRSFHADRCALIALVRARPPRFPRNEIEQASLEARINAITKTAVLDHVISCPRFTYRDDVEFSLDNFGRSPDRRFAAMAWSYQRPPIGAVGAACLFERTRRGWRRVGCIGTYGA
jgi:hypothetical protein